MLTVIWFSFAFLFLVRHILFDSCQCLGIVLWDHVTPSLRWVHDQVPIILRRATGCEAPVSAPRVPGAVERAAMSEHAEKKAKLAQMSFSERMAMSSDSDLDDNADSHNHGDDEEVTRHGSSSKNRSETSNAKGSPSKMDLLGYAQAHANITAGALMAIGLRFAGTGNEEAQATLTFHIRRFYAMLQKKGGGLGDICGSIPGDGQPEDWFERSNRVPSVYSSGIQPDRTTLEMCLGVTATSLAMVMAGTGDLDTLRTLRELRRRKVARAADASNLAGGDESEEGKKDTTNAAAEPGKYATYGNHQAIAAAMGLLFLGGGRATLSRSNEAIAALVIAFFPRYAQSTTDNRYHLQALRHLYVLAVDYRVVHAIDVDSGRMCLAPMTVSTSLHPSSQNNSLKAKLMAPCLLPEPEQIKSLSVTSPRHWPVTLSNTTIRNQLKNRGMHRQLQGLTVFVKRRNGCLPFEIDPYGLASSNKRRYRRHKMDGPSEERVDDLS